MEGREEELMSMEQGHELEEGSEITYYVPPIASYQKQYQQAIEAVASGKRVIFHNHSQPSKCNRKCWSK